MTAHRLILIRHGQTPSNVRGLLDTAVPGPGLTDLGHRQAAAMAAALRSEPIDTVLASVQLRARLTADPLARAHELPLRTHPGLREVAAGDWEMAGDERAVRGYVGRLAGWMRGESDEPTPGPNGESGSQVLRRFDLAVREAFAGGARTVAAVSHGAAIRLWAAVRAANLADDYGVNHPLHNTGVVTLLRPAADAPWELQDWVGDAVGGPDLDDRAGEGPTGETAGEAVADAADPTGGG